MTKLRVIPCCVCGRDKWRETDPLDRPGHYSQLRTRDACKCVEDERGFIIKVGPMRERA